MMRLSGSAKLYLLWGSGLTAGTATFPRLQDRGHLVSPQVHPELGILCCVQSLRLPLQRLNLRGQPRLLLLHAPIAHGLEFAGVGAHCGAVRHQGGQRPPGPGPAPAAPPPPAPPRNPRGAATEIQKGWDARADSLPPARGRPHPLPVSAPGVGTTKPRRIAIDQDLHPHSGRIRQIP